jgi:hypothetical protein
MWLVGCSAPAQRMFICCCSQTTPLALLTSHAPSCTRDHVCRVPAAPLTDTRLLLRTNYGIGVPVGGRVRREMRQQVSSLAQTFHCRPAADVTCQVQVGAQKLQ